MGFTGYFTTLSRLRFLGVFLLHMVSILLQFRFTLGRFSQKQENGYIGHIVCSLTEKQEVTNLSTFIISVKKKKKTINATM